mmetsp:Transcript_61958/g.108974  ORF Transcript_61958/g.108974 Transcript_61958/m.108974 type:complete len:338 (+) Transcript_61958:1374-2387(+)
MALFNTELLPPLRPALLSLTVGDADPKLKLFRVPAVVLGRLLDGLPSNEIPVSTLDATAAFSAFFAAWALAIAAIFFSNFSRSSQELTFGPPNTRLPSTCANTSVAPRLRYTATPSARPELPSGSPDSSKACKPKPSPEPSSPSITGGGGAAGLTMVEELRNAYGGDNTCSGGTSEVLGDGQGVCTVRGASWEASTDFDVTTGVPGAVVGSDAGMGASVKDGLIRLLFVGDKDGEVNLDSLWLFAATLDGVVPRLSSSVPSSAQGSAKDKIVGSTTGSMSKEMGSFTGEGVLGLASAATGATTLTTGTGPGWTPILGWALMTRALSSTSTCPHLMRI